MDSAKRGDVDISLLPWAWHELQNHAVRSTIVRGKFEKFVSDSAKSVNFIICLRSMFPSKVLARRLHLEYLAVSGECAEIQIYASQEVGCRTLGACQYVILRIVEILEAILES